jgi:hypothetical protein
MAKEKSREMLEFEEATAAAITLAQGAVVD